MTLTVIPRAALARARMERPRDDQRIAFSCESLRLRMRRFATIRLRRIRGTGPGPDERWRFDEIVVSIADRWIRLRRAESRGPGGVRRVSVLETPGRRVVRLTERRCRPHG